MFLTVSIHDANYINDYNIYDTVSSYWLVFLSIISSLDSIVNKDLISLDPVSTPSHLPFPSSPLSIYKI